MNENLFLTVLFPAYNEASRLPATLERVTQYLEGQNLAYEIVVVDDGSSDRTAGIVEEMSEYHRKIRTIAYKPNRGKGYAIRKGIEVSKGDYILFSDSDLSTPIEEFENFLPHVRNGASIIIGTRKHKEAKILQHQPYWRESMGKVFTWISNTVLGLQMSDFTCGFKCFAATAAKEIFGKQTIDRWAFDSEILFLAKYYGYPVVEVPVRWSNSPQTKVRIVRDTITSFLALFKIRWNALRGKYARA